MNIREAYSASGVLARVPRESRAGVSRQIVRLETRLRYAMAAQALADGQYPRLPGKVGRQVGGAKLSPSECENVAALYAGGMHQSDIAHKMGVSQALISVIIRRGKMEAVIAK